MADLLVSQYDDIINANFPKNKAKTLNSIMLYFSKYSDILEKTNFSDRPLFSDTDREIIYDAAGIIPSHMIASIKASKDISNSWVIQSNPFYVTSTLVARHCIQKKDINSAIVVCFYMSIMMYTSIHSNIFKHGVNKAVMDYTLAKLHDGFKLKKLGTLYKALEDTVRVCVNKYADDISAKNASDKDIGAFAAALHNRVKGLLKELAHEYYDNHANGRYLNLDEDNISQEDYHLASNDSFVIDNLSKKSYLNMINKGINQTCLKEATLSSDVSRKKVENILIDMINEDENQQLLKFMSSILEYYVFYSGNSVNEIHSANFIEFMLSAYKSNTNAEQMTFIKDYLDESLNTLMVRYGRVRYGKTMLNNYKKSIFMYFVYLLNRESKGGM